MNRDFTDNLYGFFKVKLNELCIHENRSYTEEEIKMLDDLEQVGKYYPCHRCELVETLKNESRDRQEKIDKLKEKIQRLTNPNTELNPIILEEIAHCRCGKGLEYEMSNGRVTFKRHNYCSNCGRKFEWDEAISEFNRKYNK